MGIFGSQGEYAKLAPLFVDKFDTEPTFSKINKGYSDFDELSKINATTGLSHEQGLANSIHQKHQSVINQVDAGELSPFKAVRLAKETAHAYLNDAVRRNVETSYKTDEESVKANKGKDALYGTREKNLGYHALKGGSEAAALNPYNAPENWDNTKWASEISNMVNADKEVRGPGVALGRVPGTIEVAKDEHEFITRQKVATYGKQLLDSNPSAKAYLEDMSYGDLYNQKYAELVNDPNMIGLPEKDKKALIYQHLNTPVKKTGTYQTEENGKVVTKKYSYSISPLQEEVEKRKEQMVNGVAGLTAFDKYDSSLNLSNIPGYGEGDKDNQGQLPSGAVQTYNENDVMTTGSNPYLEGIDDINSGVAYDVESTPITGGIAAGGSAMNVQSRKNPDEMFMETKTKLMEIAKKYKFPIVELGTASNTPEGIAKLKKIADDVYKYEQQHKGTYTQTFDNNQSKAAKESIKIKGNTASAITYDPKTGRPYGSNMNTVLDKIIKDSGDDIFSKPGLKTDKAKRDDLLENADYGGVTSFVDSNGNAELAYKLDIGGKTVHVRVGDATVNKAYADVNNLNALNKTPSIRSKEVSNPNTNVKLGFSPDDKLLIEKEVLTNGTLGYRIYNKTRNVPGNWISMNSLASILNSAALQSLDNHQIQTTFFTENEKVK